MKKTVLKDFAICKEKHLRWSLFLIKLLVFKPQFYRTCFQMTSFHFVSLATAHKFTDDSTLASFGKTIQELIGSLESEYENVLNWFNENKMIVNPGKFQAIIIYSRKLDHATDQIRTASKVKRFWVEINYKLNLEQYVNWICKSAVNQLNALIILKRFLGFHERKALVNSFVLSNFNYLTLVWMFASSKSLTKIENLYKRALRFMPENYSSAYKRVSEKSGKPENYSSAYKRVSEKSGKPENYPSAYKRVSEKSGKYSMDVKTKHELYIEIY